MSGRRQSSEEDEAYRGFLDEIDDAFDTAAQAVGFEDYNFPEPEIISRPPYDPTQDAQLLAFEDQRSRLLQSIQSEPQDAFPSTPFRQLPVEIQMRIIKAASRGASPTELERFANMSPDMRNRLVTLLQEVHFTNWSLNQVVYWISNVSHNIVMTNLKLIDAPSSYANRASTVDPSYGIRSPISGSAQILRESMSFPNAEHMTAEEDLWSYLERIAPRLNTIDAAFIINEVPGFGFVGGVSGRSRRIRPQRQLEMTNMTTLSAIALTPFDDNGANFTRFMPNLTSLTLCFIEDVHLVTPLPASLTSLIIEGYPSMFEQVSGPLFSRRIHSIEQYGRILPAGLRKLELGGVVRFEGNEGDINMVRNLPCFNSLQRLRIAGLRYDLLLRGAYVYENGVEEYRVMNNYPPALTQIVFDYRYGNNAPFVQNIPKTVKLVLRKHDRSLSPYLVNIINGLLYRDDPMQSVFGVRTRPIASEEHSFIFTQFKRIWDQWFVPLAARVNRPPPNSLLRSDRALNEERSKFSVRGPPSYRLEGVANAMGLFDTPEDESFWFNVLMIGSLSIPLPDAPNDPQSLYEYRAAVLQDIEYYTRWLFDEYLMPTLVDSVRLFDMDRPSGALARHGYAPSYGTPSQYMATMRLFAVAIPRMALFNAQIDETIGGPLPPNTSIEWGDDTMVPFQP